MSACIGCRENLAETFSLSNPADRHYFCENPQCPRYGLLSILTAECAVIDVSAQPVPRIGPNAKRIEGGEE